jgi:hypothetical protein
MQIFELNTRFLCIHGSAVAGVGYLEPQRLNSQDPALRQAVLDLSLLELQELAAIAWVGGSIFENFDVALCYAKVLSRTELVEFLQIAPGLDELDRGIQLLQSNALHLS